MSQNSHANDMKDLGSIEGGNDIVVQKPPTLGSSKGLMLPPSSGPYNEKASASSNLLTMKDLKMNSQVERDSEGHLNNSVALTNKEKESVLAFRPDNYRSGLTLDGHFPIMTG